MIENMTHPTPAPEPPRASSGAARRFRPRLLGLLAIGALAALLLAACGNDRTSVLSAGASANAQAGAADPNRIPWDYRLVQGTVGDLIGGDMTILPDNALLPNDGNYATGDKVWTLQYMSADMTTGENGNNEVKLSAWTTIKSYPDEAKAKADIADLKISLKTNVSLVGVYKTTYQGKTRNFAVITLPSGNQLKQPIDDARYQKLKSLKEVPVMVEEVHDYANYDLAYAKFRGWA